MKTSKLDGSGHKGLADVFDQKNKVYEATMTTISCKDLYSTTHNGRRRNLDILNVFKSNGMWRLKKCIRTKTGRSDKIIPEPHMVSRVSTASEAEVSSRMLIGDNPVQVTALTAKKKQSPRANRCFSIM